MGRDIQAIKISGEDRRRYRDKVRRSLDVFARMLRERLFEENPSTVGQEIELNLVDEHGMPSMRNAAVLDAIASPAWATEVGQFNLEINVPPRMMDGDSLATLETELRADLNAADARARTVGSHLVMVGILPTLAEHDVNEGTMSANERYRVLNEQIFAARGEDMSISIDGSEQLLTHTDSITPEAACTSVQLHTQVSPDAFAAYWNAAQAIAGVQVALAANSPYLFGRQLWHETRIPLFEQSTDTRPDELKEQGVRPRVWFGERWITSVFDLFEENLRYFPALLPICEEEDPLAVLDRGSIPQLAEMSLHNGTIYRWNRPVYGVVDGRPHLRVENRVLPAGPTIADVVANAAFYYGLVRSLAEAQRPIWTQMSFTTAAENLQEAARHGLDAQLYWPGVGDTPVAELILRRLLPLAREGLSRWGVDEAVAGRLLGIIEQRCLTGQTGAAWQIATVDRTDRTQRPGPPGGAAPDDPALHRPHALQRARAYLERRLTRTPHRDQRYTGGGEGQPGQPQHGQPLAQHGPGQHDRHRRVERGEHRGDRQETRVAGEEEQDGAGRPGRPRDHRQQPRPGLPGSRTLRVATATARAAVSSVTWVAATGHRPLPEPARSSPMNSSAKHAPATRPTTTPAIGRPAVGWRPRWPAPPRRWPVAEAALAETPTMAGRASTIPISARVVGRSPNSSPASTEKPAAPTALIGPATLNAACRNPRYSASAPVVPPRPATAPQARAAAAGRWGAAKGSAAVTASALTAEASSVTWMTPARREASPAAKSEAP